MYNWWTRGKSSDFLKNDLLYDDLRCFFIVPHIPPEPEDNPFKFFRAWYIGINIKMYGADCFSFRVFALLQGHAPVVEAHNPRRQRGNIFRRRHELPTRISPDSSGQPAKKSAYLFFEKSDFLFVLRASYAVSREELGRVFKINPWERFFSNYFFSFMPSPPHGPDLFQPLLFIVLIFLI